MGSVKKKPLAAMEKNQQGEDQDQGQAKKKGAKETTKPVIERKRPEVIAPRNTDQEMAKTLIALKAITIYAAARSLGVNASVAKAIITTLETKGMLRKSGGFSGHYVWTAAS